MTKKRKVTYKGSGVDVKKAEGLIGKIKKDIASTERPGSVGSIGGFGGLFELSKLRIADPVLVSGTDGVGTKLKIAQLADKHDTVGIDLVAMCANDVLCSGAEPLFFLDYIACGKLEERTYRALIKGVAKGCREAGCALIGGETAEMPGMYKKGEYDLAGFCVGAVDRKKILTPDRMRKGDVLLGLASSGLHSNGFSLVRKLFSAAYLKKNASLFLAPTRLYVKPVLELVKRFSVKGIAHITGGGLCDNLSRVLGEGLDAEVYEGSWKVPEVFKKIARTGRVETDELYATFNMGIGLVVVLSPTAAEKAQKVLKKRFGLESYQVGRISKGGGDVRLIGKREQDN